ncbi:ATP-dependent RNA helicase DHX58-like isoform X2 [Apostichopus japonicus]|uniref:ATP-dependent RNA helicase DHX58-like isoform X2 n=1 Tax=Stichopus japonicus TaxID=307972 RepID=UPI003AB718D2
MAELLKEVFSPVIEVYLNLEPAFVTHCVMQNLIDHDTAGETTKIAHSKSNGEAVKFLLSRLGSDEGDSKIYFKFLDCLRKSSDEGNQNLADHIEGLKDLPALSDHRQQFCLILKDLQPYLVENIRPTNFLLYLEPLLSRADVEALVAQERQHGLPCAAFNLLLLLQRSGSDWHGQFVRACRDIGHHDIADTLEITLEKCHAMKYQQIPEEETSTKSKTQTEEASDQGLNSFEEQFESSVEQFEECGNSPELISLDRHQKEPEHYNSHSPNWNFANHSQKEEEASYIPPLNRPAKPMVDLHENEFDNGDSDSPLYGALRSYQRELAQPAIRGLNTVLVAPTGTGKTHVAGWIIDRHFERLGKDAKVVFVVHTKILADQQVAKLTELLDHRPELEIISVTGESLSLPLPEIANVSDVLVLTAQVLLNGLVEGNDVMDIKDFTLVIFDECHNCHKGHPFKRIMDLYHIKKRKLGASNANVPQIVGMTASIGTGKAKSSEKARDHAFEILANLDADKLQKVENTENLEQFLSIPQEYDPHIVPDRDIDPFRDVLEALMNKLEHALRGKLGVEFQKRGFVGEVPLVCKGARDSQIYENWVITFQKECVRVSLGAEVQQTVRNCLEWLLDYNRALCLNRDVRTKDALSFLEKEFEAKAWRRGDFNEKLVRLFHEKLPDLKRLSETASKNPVLQRLEELIVEEFMVKKSSRALLFTRTIQSTIALKQWIEETPELIQLDLNPGRLTGATDQTSAERDHTIQMFRSGEHKLLVVTNVVEQGVDVPDCNLVFRVNYIPSDTGHVQVKGRSRARGGKSYLVASSSYGNFRIREIDNKIRETLMTRVVREISEMSDDDFMEKINDQKRKMYRDLQKEKMKRIRHLEAGRHDYSSTEYHLHCIDCKAFACSSRDIFLVKGTYRVVRSIEFRRDRIETYKMDEPRMIKPNEMAVGNVVCKKCRKAWGGMIILDEQSLVVITISGFEVRNVTTGEVNTYPKWKKAPFMSPNYDDDDDDDDYDL